MYKRLLKRFNNQFIFLFIIGAVIILAGFLIVGELNDFIYSQVHSQSQRQANSYADNIKTAMNSTEIINELLDEKIDVANEIVALATVFYAQYPSEDVIEELAEIYGMEDVADYNEFLTELAIRLSVDEISIYDDTPKVIYCNVPEVLNWQAEDGHPVKNFYLSGKISDKDPIRRDSVTGAYFKYGYHRLPQDLPQIRFIQVGIKADNIQAFLGGFEIKRLLETIEEENNVYAAAFVDNDLQVIKNSDKLGVEEILSDCAKAALEAGEEHFHVVGDDLHVFMMPIAVDGQKIGTLVLYYQLELRSLNWGVVVVVFTAVAIIVALIVTTFILNFRSSRRYLYYTYYSTLTDTPNSKYFKEYVDEDIRNKHEGKRAAVLISYRNFKTINTLFGYRYGEQVIKELADKLNSFASESRILFHLYGDRYVFYVKDYADKKELEQLCEKIVGDLKSSLITKTSGISIGAVEITDTYTTYDQILQRAFIAAGNVKEDKAIGYAFYSCEMEKQLIVEEDIKNLLQEIVENKSDALYLEYQPVLDLKTDKIYGFEALARINSPKLGFISPLKFIPIAEKTMLIIPLGKIIWEKALLTLKKLEEQGYKDIKMSVNISMLQLISDDFLPEFLQIMKKTGVNPRNVAVEITESVFYDNYATINKKLSHIRKQGITVALDDFGTGYSSLARESELNIDCIKIDKHFIGKLNEESKEKAIITEIISMAHKMGHNVIAEGVEDGRQKEYLKKNDCDCMQGYYFSKPIGEDAVLELLKKQN